MIEEAQDRDIVAEAYREVDEAMKIHDKDLPHSTANKHYFLQKRAQYKALYNEGNVDARINRKLTALENYFCDPSSSGGKWTNLNDIVVYGGINTGVKFSVYLEYFILHQEQRPKVVPPFYPLLLSQILPYLDKLEIEHYNPLTPTGSSFAGDIPVKVHQSVDDTPDTEEEGNLLRFIQTMDKAYRHYSTNARTLGEYKCFQYSIR